MICANYIISLTSRQVNTHEILERKKKGKNTKHFTKNMEFKFHRVKAQHNNRIIWIKKMMEKDKQIRDLESQSGLAFVPGAPEISYTITQSGLAEIMSLGSTLWRLRLNPEGPITCTCCKVARDHSSSGSSSK